MRAIPIKRRKDGKVVLTERVKKIIYPILCKRDGQKCKQCGYTRKTETENKLCIDHIENHKPTEHEKAGYIDSDDYQLLCKPCNTSKQRMFEKGNLETTSTRVGAYPQNTSDKPLKDNSNGIKKESVHTKDNENSPERSNEFSRDMEHSVVKSAIQVLKDHNGQLDSFTLINYALLLSQKNDKKSVMPRTAKIYLEKNTGPKKYGGKFDLKDGEYFLHEM